MLVTILKCRFQPGDKFGFNKAPPSIANCDRSTEYNNILNSDLFPCIAQDSWASPVSHSRHTRETRDTTDITGCKVANLDQSQQNGNSIYDCDVLFLN